MKKAFAKYWPLLAGVTVLAVFYFFLDGKNILAQLLAGSAPAPAPAPKKGLVAIDVNDVTAEVILTGGSTPVVPRVIAPDYSPVKPTKLQIMSDTYETPPFIAGEMVNLLSASRNV